MKFCSPEIHWFCLCKADGNLAAFLQVESAGTSRNSIEGWPSLKKKNSLQGVEMWCRFSLHIIIRTQFCFLTSCFYLSKVSENVQNEAMDLMGRYCRNTNSIVFSHLFLRGWTFEVRNVSTGCENSYHKRDNSIEWQWHVLFARKYILGKLRQRVKFKAASDAFYPILLGSKSEVVSKRITQPRLNEWRIGVRTHLQTVSTQQFINDSRAEGWLPCRTCM